MEDKIPSAYIAIKSEDTDEYTLRLNGQLSLFANVELGDWIVIANSENQVIAIGSVYRTRSDLVSTTFYFDRLENIGEPVPLSDVALTPPSSGQMSRADWSVFIAAVTTLLNKTLTDIDLIKNHEYVRELYQLAVVDDLLGPANGPLEQIKDMSVRDRYLVGRLAPLNAGEKLSDHGVDGSVEEEDDESDLEVKAEPEENAKRRSKEHVASPEEEASDEVDVGKQESLIPSSIGLTFCIDGEATSISAKVSWGRYERFYDHEFYKERKNKETGETEQGQKLKVWQRIPSGGSARINIQPGNIAPIRIDSENPNVVLQGTVREKNDNGDRLVTLFLVNNQDEPDENKDVAWIFQPEIEVVSDQENPAPIFRRRPIVDDGLGDPDQASMEMIYRKQVEFAVGHGIATHVEVDSEDFERARLVKTKVMPEHEVPVTEIPGIKEQDRSALKRLVAEGFLDMSKLATMEREELIQALTIITDDYTSWIKEQRGRIGSEVEGHDDAAKQALARCTEINRRLLEGIALLADPANQEVLDAFQFANHVMAEQRIHSLYSEQRRRGKSDTLESLRIPKNQSWRSFQLAFLLLSMPSLADPAHKERSDPDGAIADLIWFPTGGGKTEAYLGVAAFTMAIRRYQNGLGGYDSSRGLAVIMRYTLRLLTLQQFQRATALICAMEVTRSEALEKGDGRLGETPFTIGLWVGNKVTPGTNLESRSAIEDIKNPDKFYSGTSPAQLTSCPWCGSDVHEKINIEIDKEKLQTAIYCGDKRSQCAFSKGQSISLAHPGLPAVVVDEEIYHRPPSMMIATVDKFAMLAWRGQTKTLFGKAEVECPRHGLVWKDDTCNGTHKKTSKLPGTTPKVLTQPIRPPDLIIQDEFHLISGPLGTMVGLYETAVDELATWTLNEQAVKPKVVASTATVRKAAEQMTGVFDRRVSIFPPSGLDIEDNFFSVQRSITEQPGRRYLGICSPGSSRPAILIRLYVALGTASQALFNRFGEVADPYMTTVGYFNSLRELGGMKRLAEDDVRTRSYRVAMSEVSRPGLAQRTSSNTQELTSRVSSQDIPKYLDQLDVRFKSSYDATAGKFITEWDKDELRAIDIVLATNMLSVGVDVDRLGVMAVNGQPKTTAEYIQATCRVGRSFPGLVCTVLTWSRPRDLSHYETFEHYHGTFYQHVEAQSVTPFSKRAIDRGLTGAMISLMRLNDDELNPNDGAHQFQDANSEGVIHTTTAITDRAYRVSDDHAIKDWTKKNIKKRSDEWVKQTSEAGKTIAYEKKGANKDRKTALITAPGMRQWTRFTVPMSMREVETPVLLQMNNSTLSRDHDPDWKPPVSKKDQGDGAA